MAPTGPVVLVGHSMGAMVVLASQLSAAKLVHLDGAGHSVALERVEEVAVAIAALIERVRVDTQGPDAFYAAAG